MIMKGFLVVFVNLVTLLAAQSVVQQSDDGSSGTISFSTPTLSDDDAHSPWMPDQLKCDACTVVAFKLWTAFEKYNEKRKSLNYKLAESDVLTITEEICNDQDAWKDYGVKEVNKVKRLSGPGTESNEVPGVLAGGGRWPSRLQDMCETYMGDIGEMEIYKVYKRDPKNRKNLENYLCRGKGIRGECVSSKKAAKEEL